MRTVLAALFLTALASTAWANGRDPYSSSIHWKRGGTQDIVAGMTFGLVISHDGGATWQWMCEKAVGYGGNYDPDYEYMSSGAIFATTFDGLKVMRDGCTFTATPPGMTFVSRDTQAPNGDFYFAAADATDSKIYKSTYPDDGMTFSSVTPPGGLNNDWWQSIEVAKDSQHLYLTGYRLVMKCTSNSGNPGATCTQNTDCTNGGMCDPQKEFLLYKSVNAGGAYSTMTMTGIGTTSQNSTIDIVGIDPTDATGATLYIKVTLETGSIGDSIYRTTNSGATWTKIFTQQSKFGLAFLVRSDGSCVTGTRELGAWKATTCSSAVASTTSAPLGSFTTLAGAPHIGCLYEGPAPAHEVWACTQNTAVPQLGVDADNYGIMKSTNLTSWTGVLKYQDIQAPVACALKPELLDQQQYYCIERYEDMQSPWCCLVPQVGITSTSVDCSGARGCFNNTIDGAIDAGTTQPPKDHPCGCDADAGPSALLGSLFVGGLLLRRRRRR